MKFIFAFSITVCYVLLLLGLCDAAKYCYSGRNNRYEPTHCSRGSFDVNYVCHKYTCEGGRSPFVLRTCAMKSMGCMAGSRICKFSGGKGSCDRCEGELCNSAGKRGNNILKATSPVSYIVGIPNNGNFRALKFEPFELWTMNARAKGCPFDALHTVRIVPDFGS